MSDFLLQDLDQTVARIVNVLYGLNRPFAFTGGLAALTYGDPRTTRDVDVVIEIEPWETEFPDRLSKALGDAYFFNAASCRQGIEQQSMFQALDKETMFKIDFHLNSIIPDVCGRSREVQTLNGRLVPMITPEDAVLSKLYWIKLGSERSAKDVVAMLRLQKNLDNDYISRNAELLNVTEILARLRKIAENAHAGEVL